MPYRLPYTPVPPIISDSVFTSDNAHLCKLTQGAGVMPGTAAYIVVPTSASSVVFSIHPPTPSRGGIAHPPPFEKESCNFNKSGRGQPSVTF